MIGMEIKTIEQAVLELILKHWEDPLSMDYFTTINKVRELWPVTEKSICLDWEFHLTEESLKYLSKKYLGKDLEIDIKQYLIPENQYTLLVDSSNLSFQILSWEQSMADFSRRMSRTYLGL